ncbi:MAG TPA: AI-2E family transporter [Bacteroidales bacterium]|nr:AI-2E family transporter [Bacteroidales bacterium]
MEPDTSNTKLLTPNQKKMVGSALAALSVVVILGIVFATFLIFRAFVMTFSNVLMPLAIAGILAMLLRPIVTFFENKLKLSRIKSIVLLYALVIVCLCGVLSLAAPILIGQLQDLFTEIPRMLTAIREAAEKNFPDLVQKFRDNVGGKAKFDELFTKFTEHLETALTTSFVAINSAKTSILGLFGWIAAYAVIPIYLFYLLDSTRDFKRDLDDHISFIQKPWRDDMVFLITEFVKILVSFFRGQIIIAIILAIMLAGGFSLVGLKFGFILGLIIGLLNIVPYLGTILGIVTVLPIAYFQPDGGLALIGLCAVVFVVAQLITDYLLTPKIMGKETGLSPMAIIFSIFFWGVALQGILGMVLAIPLSAFFVIFWRLAKRKYIPQLLGSEV